MRKRFRKIVAVLLVVVMIALMIPFSAVSVSAGTVIETAISWAVSIANDDSHGYSWDGRWDPDYDCSSLVISAFRESGLSLSGATTTVNMRSVFTKEGFTWIPASQIDLSNPNSLVRGDILLNESSHTEIYLGNGQNVGAHRGYMSQWCSHSNSDGKYHRHGHYSLGEQKGDQDGGEISVAGYYNYPWDGVLRYKDEPVNPPTNVWLGKNQVWYDIQDTINLAPHADGADYYWFSVYKDGQQIISQAIYGEYCFSANQWGYGDYSAYITAANSVGGTDSEWVDFSVVGVPSYNSIYKSSYWYDITDTVSITVESVCAKGQVIGIDKEGVGRVVTESCDTTFSIAASQLGVGDYSAYFSIYNGSGGIDTERIAFSIVGSPSYSDVYASKTIYKTDDTVAITVDTVCAKGQVIGIDKEGVGRVVTENCDSTYYISASQLGVGKYSCYFSVYNGSGSIDTKRAFFEIVDEYSSANLGNDFYGYIRTADTEKVLANNNRNVELSTQTYSCTQLWRFIRNNDNTYTIISILDNNAIDVAGAEGENGTNIQTYECNDSNAQRWYIIECKNGYILIPKSAQNKVADLSFGHTEAGTNLQLYDYNGTTAQIFYIDNATPDKPYGDIGDTNLDGTVSISDVTSIQRYLTKAINFTDEQLAAADTNGDGKVDINDATYLQMYLARYGVTLGISAQ